MFEQAATQIEMVVFGSAGELWFVEEWRAELIGFGEEIVDSLAVKRVRDDEVAVGGE